MNYEVLVVGGGPAGSTAAKFLSEEGIETCLIERNLEFKKPCGGGIPSAGLKDLGILDEVTKKLKFRRVKKVIIIPPYSEPLEVELQKGEILIFNRFEFDSFLRKIATEKGATLIEGEVVNLEKNKSIKATVKLKNGTLREIICKYLIAADGVNSKICSLSGIKKPNFFWTISSQIQINSELQTEACEFWFGSTHASFFYSWVFPGNNYLSIGTGSPKAKELKNFIDNFIKKRFPSTNISDMKLRAYKIPKWEKRPFYMGNIILCGDALGTVMPVSFEGIYYAMKSAQFASEAIKQKDLNIYEKLWEQRFGRQFFIMKNFQDYMFGDDKRIDKWLNKHRNPHIQELAMALWLRKEKTSNLTPLYLKAFGSLISRILLPQVKINM